MDDSNDHSHGAGLHPHAPAMDRRDLMKLGAGVVLTTLAGRRASAQAPARGSVRAPGEIRPHTGPGYRNDFNRLAGNGPMDDTTRRIVRFVHEFDASNLTDPVVHALNRTMLDTAACIVAGFEEEPVRIAARLARLSPAGALECTVLGYGISTTPELAAFANSTMARVTDFNDTGAGGHNSDLIPAVLAVGEALHSTGLEVLTAITIGYELRAVPAGGEAATTAMAVGKLMKLDEDRLANALSIAITPHVALNKGVGALSMWKGVRSAEAIKCGVWAALLAREGMTGPPQPFEGVGALWARNGSGRAFTLPDRPPQLAIERMGFKRTPSDAQSQACLELIPEMRAWTTADEIASIEYDMTEDNWEEIADAAKWDPRNRETADHSMPYLLARALIDGYIYLDSFTPQKYLDPAARALMARMTFGPVKGWSGLGTARITIQKTSGERRSWDTLGGVRNPAIHEFNTRMSDDEIAAKLARACAYKRVADAQRDRIRAEWWNLRAVKDIAGPIRALARFGAPSPL